MKMKTKILPPSIKQVGSFILHGVDEALEGSSRWIAFKIESLLEGLSVRIDDITQIQK